MDVILAGCCSIVTYLHHYDSAHQLTELVCERDMVMMAGRTAMVCLL